MPDSPPQPTRTRGLIQSLRAHASGLFSERIAPWLASLLIAVFGTRNFSARLYYLFNHSFVDEMRSTLLGVTRAKQEDLPFLFYDLARDTHRIEKGLCFEKRKNPFAEAYILDAVQKYKRIMLSHDPDQLAGNIKRLQWTHHVFTSYFDFCTTTKQIEEARKVFESVTLPADWPKKEKDGIYHKTVLSTITYAELASLMQQRCSVRSYLAKPVPREDIDRAIALASLAPSGCNRQPFKYIVIEDRAILATLSRIAYGIDPENSSAPCVLALVGDMSAFFDERDRHLAYIDGALSMMALLLALETLGISSCCINMPDEFKVHKRIRRALHLGAEKRVIMMATIGYANPAAAIPVSTKKDLSEIREYMGEAGENA